MSLYNTLFYLKCRGPEVFCSAGNTTIGVQTKTHFSVSKLKTIAASSLYNSIEDLQVSLRKQLRELAHSGSGFRLNPESVNKPKKLYCFLKSEEFVVFSAA